MKSHLPNKKFQGIFLLFFFLGLSCQSIFANTSNQSRVEQERYLSEILDEIGEKYQVFFNYESSLISDIKLDFKLAEAEDLNQAVDRLMRLTNLKYELASEKFVIIYRNDKKGKKKARKAKRRIKKLQKLEKKGDIQIQHKSSNPVKHSLNIMDAVTILQKAEINISGTVQSEDGNPLIGATVVVKGASIGTATDLEGNYTLENVSETDVLIFSYTGYAAQEIVVGNQTVINVTLLEAAALLGEVTVVGYGTKKKSNVVGSVATVNVEKATALPTTNVSEMLRGRAAGVQVNLADARPGGGSDIVIRGNVSVAPNGNGPLIIVDGLPFDNLNDIAPDDIANIEILKDASSTAIYGSRASNGVILVTTKSGKEGKISVNYHGYITTQSVTKNFNQYTGEQFIDLRREANRNRFTGEYLNDQNVFSPFEQEAIANQDYVDWGRLNPKRCTAARSFAEPFCG